ncbi:hypothetical protein G9A89_001760 [Geosiphon pyriformis]|nr:hypothetical protein G9A89_001760 [Geosiphon pyriformis]
MDQLGCQVDRAASTRIIIADGATKTSISEIDNFPFEVNNIVTPIKVLVMEATQYQNTQELQLTYQGRHICVPVTCGHFKTPPREKLLIKLEKEKEKPTWEAYQLPPILVWDDNNNGKEEQGKEPICETTIDAGTNDKDHYKLPPVLSWDDNPKGKQRKELTWETNNLTWTDNEQEKASSWEWNKDKGKGKEKEEGTLPTTNSYNSYTHHTSQQSNY